MGLGASVKCARCSNKSSDLCEHCGRSFCTSHFRTHNCMDVRGSWHTNIRSKPGCVSCNNNAVGSCDECKENVCSLCFSLYHEDQCGRKYTRKR